MFSSEESLNSNKQAKDKFLKMKDELIRDIPRLMKKNGVPGLAIAIIHDGQVKAIQGFGYSNKKNRISVDCDTIFQVGSLSKAVTAWGVMKLVEAGEIDLDEQVDKYLTRWHLSDSIYNHQDITIRRVLAHTGGLSVKSYLGVRSGKPLYTLEQSLSGLANKKYRVHVANKPGSVYYSGGGYTLLQLILEEVSGQTFAKYMEKEIFQPLGMYSSTFEQLEEMGASIALPYGVFGGRLPVYRFTEKAAAGLRTNINDMTKFVMAHMAGSNNELIGRGVLRETSIKEMFSRIERNVFFGLGYTVRTLSKNKMIIQRGRNRGWYSRIDLHPKRREGFVIMTNSSIGSNLTSDILSRWYSYILDTEDLNTDALFLDKHDKFEAFIMDKIFEGKHTFSSSNI